MKVRLCVLGEVKVDDHIDSLNVNASGEQVWWRGGGGGGGEQEGHMTSSKKNLSTLSNVTGETETFNTLNVSSSGDLPVLTRFLHSPFLKSWNTRFLYSWKRQLDLKLN